MSNEPLLEEIAVVGLSGRFPGARDVEAFWQNLCAGKESIVEISEEALRKAGVSEELLRDPSYVRARGMLDDVDLFDPEFFEILPREAAHMDPQHRLVLEHAWAALEHAGCDPERFAGDIGVFAGGAQNSYLLANLVKDRAFIQDFLAFRGAGQFQTSLGNDKDFLTSRIAYKLNLTGPAISVQTSCSTSLAAICQAVQSLLTYQCDLALAGGVTISFPLERGYHYSEGGMVSPDGHCRAFDARAQGTVFGNGLGLVVLRRLSEAVAAGDTIYAVIKAAALNNDGSAKVSYTAPSVEGQARVIQLAHQIAGISADSVSYLEAHGTGTPLGDPIEVAALTKAFRATTDKTGYCAIGSVKTNIGHLDAAAGVAGFIKTVLALHHRELPPTLHYEQPNPGIDFANSPFVVNTTHRPWSVEGPLRAGVSSFGVGGTNAHVVLEEAPALEATTDETRPQVLVLSAKTPAALERMTESLTAHLAAHPELSLADVAHTLQTGRRVFPHRRAFVCEQGLGPAFSALEERRERKVIFLFPGQGAQSSGMGRGLYHSEAAFRTAYDACARLARPFIGVDLCSFMEPGEPASEWHETRVAQPALFATSYALAQLWLSWGVQPSAVAGHSVGEYVAATLAGVFSLKTAVALVAQRARMVHDLPTGAMLAVRLGADELQPLLPSELVIAAINSPKLCVVAGPEGAVALFESQLATRKIAAKRLASAHAFHSPMVQPIVEPFRALVATASLRAPTLPIVSCTTGTWLAAEQATDAAYWARHLREPVRFVDVLGTLLAEGDALLLEAGPGQGLTTLARQHPTFTQRFAAAASLPTHENEPLAVANALARLWLAGVPMDWAKYRGEALRRKVALPTYPFERRRCWVEPPREVAASGLVGENVGALPVSARAADGLSRPLETPHRGVATTSAPVQTAVPVEPVSMTLATMLHDLSGELINDAALDATFLDLAFDSLLLTQFRQELQQRFGVRVTARKLFEDLATPRALAAHLETHAVAKAPAVDARSAQSPLVSVQREGGVTHSASTPHRDVATAVEPVLATLQRMLHDLSGVAIEGAALDATFLDLAFDSLLLTQFRQELQQRFGVRISSRQLFENLSTPRALAAHLEQSASTPAPAQTTNASIPTAANTAPAALAPGRVGGPPAMPGILPGSPSYADRNLAATPPPSTFAPQAAGPFQPLQRQSEEASLTPAQRDHLRALTERLSAKHAKSKAFAQKYRQRLADPRSVAGFRRLWKELTFQTVIERSQGSHLWDVDGHEYIDITMGFGANLLGHSPAYILEAVQQQLGHGYPIGPQTALAGEAADLICEMTGAERVTFCNTGSEAVMAALRVARAVTGRDKIVYFNGDYHGNFDEVLLRPGMNRALPVAVGIPGALGENVLVLEYGSPAALEILQARAHEIAAVLVEPVQSRHPEVLSATFLHELRAFTSRTGSLLIFDEVITGFRAHQAGCQGYFGIEADLATYGKIVGGGFPIGVLAGKASALDAIDGGCWQYGDDSFPEADMTFFAGTFVRHPLALAAGLAVLRHLKKEGPQLQVRLNATAEQMRAENNARLEAAGVPMRINGFSSLFRFEPTAEFTGFPILCFHLREAGIYIREPKQNCFLSTAHTPEDIANFSSALEQGLQSMEQGGWMARSSTPVISAKPALVATAPLTQAQAEIWVGCKMYPEQSRAFNESMWMRLRGPLAMARLRQAWRTVLQRHDALRAQFDPQGTQQRFEARLELDFPLTDWSHLPADERDMAYSAAQRAETAEPLDLEQGPMARVRLGKLGPEEHVVFFTAHHLVCDGWSAAVLLEEFCQLYGETGTPAPTPSYAAYARAQVARRDEPAQAADEVFWQEQLTPGPPVLELPSDRPRPPQRTFDGAREELLLSPALTQGLRDFAQRQRCTLHSVLFATFNVLLARLSGEQDLVVGVAVAGQSEAGLGGLVGHCVNVLPVRSRLVPEERFSDLLARTRGALLDAQEHASVSFGRLLQLIPVPRQANRIPLVSVLFNLDPTIGTLTLPGLEVQIGHAPRSGYQFDLGFNVIVEAEGLRVECDYSAELFKPQTILRWIAQYQAMLEALASGTALTMGEWPPGVDAPSTTREALPESTSPRPTATPIFDEPDAVKPIPLTSAVNGSHPGSPTHRRPERAAAARFASPLEEQLGSIWAEVLEHEDFGREDDFFEVGGHSILAMGMLYKVETQLGHTVPVSQLFENSTLAGLAGYLEGLATTPVSSAPEPRPSLFSLSVVQAGRPAATPLVYVVGAEWEDQDEAYRMLARAIDPQRPFYLLRPRGWDGRVKPHQSKQMLLIDYLAELRSVRPVGPCQLVGDEIGGVVAQELYAALPASDRRESSVTMLNTARPGAWRGSRLAQSLAGMFRPGAARSPVAVARSPVAELYQELLKAAPEGSDLPEARLVVDAETQAHSGALGWEKSELPRVPVVVLPESTGDWLGKDLPALADALR